MLSSHELRFIEGQGALDQKARVILSELRQYFVRQASNGETRLMIRFRDKGGVQGSVRQSSNTSVLDVFCVRSTKEAILEIIKKELEFDVVFVETPYSFYLVSWEIPEKPEPNNSPVRYWHLDDGSYLLNNRVHYIDTSGGSFSVYLPKESQDKDWIRIEDVQGAFSKNPLFVRVPEDAQFNILGKDELGLDIKSVQIELRFDQDSKRWIPDFKNIKLVKEEC